MATPLRVGIIGLGHLHPRTYVPHFEATQNLEIVAASDRTEMLREGFEKDFGVRAYADWRELLAGEEIDLAYIFLPRDECPAAAVACAEKKVGDQEQHHGKKTFQEEFRGFLDRYGIEYDERYVWD